MDFILLVGDDVVEKTFIARCTFGTEFTHVICSTTRWRYRTWGRPSDWV